MNRERLLNLARAVREHPNPSLFRMVLYAVGGVPSCPLGCYAARTDLQSEFKLIRYEDVCPTGSSEGVGLVLTGENVDHGDFARELLRHFEIDQDQARKLFGMYGCGDARTAPDAAKYIESFAAQEDGARTRD